MSAQNLKIHFIGIGGIGVSALAQYYFAKGHEVSGSDLVSSEIIRALRKKGIKIFLKKHKTGNLPKKTDLVIYSPAVRPDNPELKEAKKRKIKLQTYPQALAELTKQHFTIAVSGTHGKSTTTAMAGLLLVKAGLDPTVIVGTKLKEFNNSNYRVGKSQYLLIEADEHFASFLNYRPRIIILTCIEKDHLDYYKNLKNIIKAFKEYVGHLPKTGWLIANKDDQNVSKIKSLKSKYGFKVKDYSLNQPEAKKLKKVLKVPGRHNISNALATLNLARILRIPDKISLEALSQYKGCWRRFEECQLKIGKDKIRLVSDYGHHPTEVKVTLKAAREKYPQKKIWCVYQPHQYQRTYYLFNDFVKVFKEAPIDKIIITDIYDVAGREKGKIRKKVSSGKLVKAVKKDKVVYLAKEKIMDLLKKEIKQIDVLIVMGAGNIYQLVLDLKKLDKNN